MSGAPGFASPVVMSSAVAAEGAWCEPGQLQEEDGQADAEHRRGHLGCRGRSGLR